LLASGGTANHAHLLYVLPATMDLAKSVQILKANSSRWMREHTGRFQWQKGYGAFSVSESNKEKVKTYIANQIEHHKKHSFEQEYLSLLTKHNIKYDLKYVFD
jgi:REP element-mobilizing transposase RayT